MDTLDIKFRFVCKDLSKNIFTLFYRLDEFLNGFNLANNGRIESIIAKNLFLGHDNRGKEIYENDIGILGDYPGSHGIFTCVLKFDVKTAHFNWVDVVSHQIITGRPSDARLIGNIYETPEFLIQK